MVISEAQMAAQPSVGVVDRRKRTDSGSIGQRAIKARGAGARAMQAKVSNPNLPQSPMADRLSQPISPPLPADQQMEMQRGMRKEDAQAERRVYPYSVGRLYDFVREQPRDETSRAFMQQIQRALFPKHLGYLTYEEMPDTVKIKFDAFSDIWVQQESAMLSHGPLLKQFLRKDIYQTAGSVLTGIPFTKEWQAANELLAELKKVDPQKARWVPFSRPAIRFLNRCADDTLQRVYGEKFSVFDDADPNNATWEKKRYRFVGREKRDVELMPDDTRQYDTQVSEARRSIANKNTLAKKSLQELAPEEQKEFAALFLSANKRHKVVHGVSLLPHVGGDLEYQRIVPVGEDEKSRKRKPRDVSENDVAQLGNFLVRNEGSWSGGQHLQMYSEHDQMYPSMVVIRPRGGESGTRAVVIDGSLLSKANDERVIEFFARHFPGVKVLINRSDIGIDLAQLAFSQRMQNPRYHGVNSQPLDEPTEVMDTPPGSSVSLPEFPTIHEDLHQTQPTLDVNRTARQMVVGPDLSVQRESLADLLPHAQLMAVQEGRSIVTGSGSNEWVGIIGYTPSRAQKVKERKGSQIHEPLKEGVGRGVGFLLHPWLGNAIRKFGRPAGFRATQEAALRISDQLNKGIPYGQENPFGAVDGAFSSIADRRNLPKGAEGAVAQVIRHDQDTYLAVQQVSLRHHYNVYMTYRPGYHGEVMRVVGKRAVVPFANDVQGEQTVLIIPPIPGIPQQELDALASSVLRNGRGDIAQLFNAALLQSKFRHGPVAVGVMKVASEPYYPDGSLS